jgi:hypothetical protein
MDINLKFYVFCCGQALVVSLGEELI